MSAPTRDCYSVMICSIRKVHRSRKQLPCAIHRFLRELRIHRLGSAIHGSDRSTDCTQHLHMTCPEVAMYIIGHVPKGLCTELDMSRSGYVPKRICPETVKSQNGYVPKLPVPVPSRVIFVPIISINALGMGRFKMFGIG